MSDSDDAGYAKALSAMAEGARRWMAAHPFAQPEFRTAAFERELIAAARAQGKHAPDGKSFFIAALDEHVIARWAANLDAQHLLRAMDAATGHQGTYEMAKTIIEDAQQRALEKRQGKMPSGHWRCTCCDQLLDGFTALDGQAGKPIAGTYTVCAYCVAIQRVADSGDRFEAATLEAADKEYGPAFMLDLRNAQALVRTMREQRRADEKGRS